MEEIILVLADRVDPEEFLDLIVGLGGVRQDEYEEGRLSRGNKHVWVTTDERKIPPIEPAEHAAYEAKLGAPARQQVILAISSTAGSDQVALEIIEAAARRWRLIVDNNLGGLYTVAELRALADSPGLPFA